MLADWVRATLDDSEIVSYRYLSNRAQSNVFGRRRKSLVPERGSSRVDDRTPEPSPGFVFFIQHLSIMAVIDLLTSVCGGLMAKHQCHT